MGLNSRGNLKEIIERVVTPSVPRGRLRFKERSKRFHYFFVSNLTQIEISGWNSERGVEDSIYKYRVETSERALRERIVWRGERFPVGVSDPPGLHLLVEEVGFLDIKVSRQSKKATSGSNRCFDHDSLLPVRACCHAGKSRGFGQFYLLLDLNQ
ncbi:unnamed protein product [Fraxinus pennsylvanica]|uniref:Uncharacterized protein n=1 Tax=Fraxinus pennsylvanica TaxID=56036 RepID=A0AAD1ZR18_9LAMI|nr:unnamed protein product [Fraxinus pennsylvanica]